MSASAPGSVVGGSADRGNNGGGGGGNNGTRRGRLPVVVGVLAVAAVAAGAWYFTSVRPFESTDDAFIEGDIVQVSTRVSGQVLRVLVSDNQHVNKGDLLAEIDPADYEARLAEARGKLADSTARESTAQSNLALTSTVSSAVLVQANAALGGTRDQQGILKARLAADEATIQAARAGLAQAKARQAAAEAEATRAASDAERYRALFAKDEVSKQMLDRSAAEARATAANLEATRQMVAAATAQIGQAEAVHSATLAALHQTEELIRQAAGRVREAQSAPHQVRVRQSDVQAVRGQMEQTRAAVRQAELGVSYTRIYASDSGWITRKSIQPGNFVQVGQALMALVSDRKWVVANFKETQLTHMRPGQAVAIKVDAYPDRAFKGKVESVQSGTGARFSLMPPENATGNYVKVVQRVPVKIVFDEALPADLKVGPGMSVTPEVRVR
jgi:membrane fusion protein, multidrug efflux system